jgi:Uma2 family endonuclease
MDCDRGKDVKMGITSRICCGGAMSLTVKDLEKMQEQLPDYRMELVDGEIVVISPSGYESDEIAAEIIRQLGNWVRPRRLGRVAASSAGFRLPNASEDVRAPDCSFVQAARLRQTTEDFARLVPDLFFEVKSKTDSLEKLRQKIQVFLSLGAQVGVLVDPRTATLEVYHSDVEVIILQNGDVFTASELLPGWEMAVSEIWAPEFD